MDPAIGAALDDAARARLVAFVELLARWNQAFNLTAVRDPLAMVPRHLLDSLAVLPWISTGPVLDLGTGAGLPGIPLAIARPDLAFTLLDGNGKKTRFVRQAVATLGLGNCTVVQGRAETYRPPAKFATIVVRAVAPLADLLAVAAPLAAPGACLLALKGRLPTAELAALAPGESAQVRAATPDPARTPGQTPALPPTPTVHRLAVPGVDGERHLIAVPFDHTPHG